MAAIVQIKNWDENIIKQGKSVEKWYICLIITQVRSLLNFGNNPLQAKAKKVDLILLHWNGMDRLVTSTGAILIGDPVDVT